MAINETISGTGVSSSTTPASVTTDVVVENPGGIILEAQVTGGNWVPIKKITKSSMTVLTPDSSITYRFRAEGVTQTTRVYFGP